VSRLYCDNCKRRHSGPDNRWLLTEQGMKVLAHIRLRESWSEAAVAVEGASPFAVGELGGERQPYSRIQEGLDGG